MQTVALHALPESDKTTWTLEYFSEYTEDICRTAAVELHKKSLMVEEAVEEILQLVQRVQEDCPPIGDDLDFCFDGVVIVIGI